MIHVIIGAPCSGKSTYVRENAKEDDVRVDYDLIASALGAESHSAKGHIRESAFKARETIIDYCIEKDCEAWIIHTSPTQEQMEKYSECGADFHVMETDLETCLERAQERPPGTTDVIESWFSNPPQGDFLMPDEKGNTLHKYKEAPSAAEVADGGTVKGYASTFDRDPDAYGDVIAKGAFANSLKKWEEVGKPIPLLYGHNTDDPEYNIGKVTHIEEDERGLYVEAEFDPDNPKAQYVRKLVKEGRLYQFSFAFDCLDYAEVTLEDGTKANELRELDIFEVSLVQIPANQHAEVTDIKNATPEAKSGRRNSKADADELRAIAEHAEAIQSIVNGLLAESAEEEANAEEPKANAEEQTRNALIDEAEQLIKSRKEN